MWHVLQRKERRTEFWLKTLQVREKLEDLVVDGRTILRYIFNEAGWEYVGWIHVTQDKDTWRSVVNTVMSARVP